MWTALSFLLLFFGGMLAFSLGGRYYFFKSKKISLPKLDVFSAAFLCISFALGGVCLYGCYEFLPLYTWAVMLLLLWGLYYFSQKDRTPIHKICFQLALCAVGVFGILTPMPQAKLLYWLIGLDLTISWFVGWRVITYFDKYPMTSYLISSSWAVALLLIYCILNVFPPEISLFAGVLGISVYVICRKRLSYGILNLGPHTAEIMGFIWAGIWTLCLQQTNLLILLLFYGYYVLEMIVLLSQRLKKKPLETLLARALPDEKNRKRAISLIFFHVVALTILAVFLSATFSNPHLTISMSLVLGGIVCFNLYNHLKNLDRRIGSWKEIFSDLKEGVSVLPKASKDFAKEFKDGLRTQTRKKKTNTKKSVGKKKGNKKKK